MPSGNDKNRRPLPSGAIGGVVKADIEPMNASQQQTDKATRYHWETP